MNLEKTINWNEWQNSKPTIDEDSEFSDKFVGIIRHKNAPNDKMLCSPEIFYVDKRDVIWYREHKPMSHNFEMIYWIYLDDLFNWK